MFSASEGIFEKTAEEDTEINGITYKKGTCISQEITSNCFHPVQRWTLWAKIMIIKFLKRYQTLVEPGINNRTYSIHITSHL